MKTLDIYLPTGHFMVINHRHPHSRGRLLISTPRNPDLYAGGHCCKNRRDHRMWRNA